MVQEWITYVLRSTFWSARPLSALFQVSTVSRVRGQLAEVKECAAQGTQRAWYQREPPRFEASRVIRWEASTTEVQSLVRLQALST